MDEKLAAHIEEHIDTKVKLCFDDFKTTILRELEERIFARLGRWAWAAFGGLAALIFVGAANWFSHESRITLIERWKEERKQPIDEYYKKMAEQDAKLSELSGKVDAVLSILRQKDNTR